MFGRVGGLMGMMGAMLGVMINVSPVAMWVTAGLMVALFLLSMVALVRLVQISAARQCALDPVCGMAVDTATAKLTSDYRGNTIYFCAPGCKRAFDKAPEKYIAIGKA